MEPFRHPFSALTGSSGPSRHWGAATDPLEEGLVAMVDAEHMGTQDTDPLEEGLPLTGHEGVHDPLE